MMMIKMMPLDMSWFLFESKFVPVHGALLHVFTPPVGARPDYVKRLLATMKKRAAGAPFNLLPRFRIAAMPCWEEVAVDLSRHVIETRLPAPGNDQQLLAAAAELAAPALDWKQPLWRIHWIDGLAGGRFAFMLVAHHSQWDGISIFRLMGETMSESASAKIVRAPWQGVSTWIKLASGAAARQGKEGPHDDGQRQSALAQITGLLEDTASAATGMGRVFAQQGWQALVRGRQVALPFAAAETRAERNGSSARTYGLAKIQAARVKAVAQATGASFNDVMTSVADAAYVSYLAELGIVPGKRLVAMVPIALKIPGAGNQISNALVPLGAPGATPLERLAAVRTAMDNAKREIGGMGAASAKLFALVNTGIAAAPDLLGVGERLPVTANMMISNPYGIPKALYLNGSRLDYFVPFVGPSLGTRLLVGIYTYAGETFVAITSLRSVVPTVERLSELVQVSFAELEQAAGVAQQPAAKRAAVAGQPAVRRRKAARTSV
jgi:WS/DGAT/MGAT family acyltransferase